MNKNYSFIRRNQIVGRSGPGSLFVTHDNITVLMTGLQDWWNQIPVIVKDENRKRENRLQVLEEYELRDTNLEMEFGVSRFIEPPVVDDESNVEDYSAAWFIPATRFPMWEYCPFTSCGSLTRNSSAEASSQRACPSCKESGKRNRYLQQVPLVSCCPDGHLDEIDWTWLIHNGDPCAHPSLTFRDGGNALLPKVACKTCGAKPSLRSEEGDYQIAYKCTGVRAWLPESNAQVCEQTMLSFLRTSTSVYFPNIRSALHLPPPQGYRENVLKLLQSKFGDYLAIQDSDGVREVIHKGVTDSYPDFKYEDTLRHIERARMGSERAERQGKAAEIEALETPRSPDTDGLPILDSEPRELSDYDTANFPFLANICSIVAVHRLAETRVLAGFTRVEPPRRTRTAQNALDELWGHVPKRDDATKSWLPANRIFGEGIFLEIDSQRLDTWARVNVEHFKTISVNDYHFEPKAVVVHTLAHLLINAASLECGYPVASIRDRIYFEDGRFGLLIYTAAGDSVGTMGGLVDLITPGKLESLLQRALMSGEWCNLDPVCNSSPSEDFEGNGGACHQCCYLPETSCEWFNQALDRATLVGGRGSAQGFFSREFLGSIQ